jgi:hypothetical protein
LFPEKINMIKKPLAILAKIRKNKLIKSEMGYYNRYQGNSEDHSEIF